MIPLTSTDFLSAENKADIRTIIINEFKLDGNKVQNFFFNPEPYSCIDKINLFVDNFPDEAGQIFNLSLSGIGPGEVLLYFLCDKLTLSGFSAKVDTIIDGVPFAEIKAAQQINDQTFGDFRFGGVCSEANYEMLKTIRTFVNHSENPTILENELEIPKKKINELRSIQSCSDEFNLNIKILAGDVFIGDMFLCKRNDINFSSKIQMALDMYSEKVPNTFDEIEDQYFSKILKILDKQNFLFFDRKTFKAIYFGVLRREMLSIERITQGRIKPYINFKY